MRYKRIGARGVVFSFAELDQTNILTIFGERFTYICDTFLGPEPMEEIKQVIKDDGRKQPIILFNSHSDWDHVWGNCAFSQSTIISHEQCLVNLKNNFFNELSANSEYAMGDIKPEFPNILFKERLSFPDDAIEFFYTPGHTNDSASCLDKEGGILYVGDNVEYPIPYIQSPNLESYITTLKKYIELEPKYIVTGHGNHASMELIVSNINYITKLSNNEAIDQTDWGTEHRERHNLNIEFLLKS